MQRSTGIFEDPTDPNRDYFNLVSGKRHSCVRFYCTSGGSDGIIFGAGSSDESKNCVSVWSLHHALDSQQNERRLCASSSFDVDSRVTCTEFLEGNTAAYLSMWIGLSDGTVLLVGNRAGNEPLALFQNVNADAAKKALHSAAVSAIAAHSQEPKCLTVAEDGKMFELVVDSSGSVRASQWPEILDWMAVYDVKYGSDGRSFFSAGGSGQVKMWDQRAINRPKIFGGTEADGMYFTIEPFDRADASGMGAREELLLAGGSDGRVSVFDMRQV